MQLDQMPPYGSLRLLQLLCEKRNLAAAAETLGLSISAASRRLSELRALFGDPLFTRFPGGLMPTRRALRLADEAETVIRGYDELMRPKRFDPAGIVREVRIGCADNAPFSLFPNFAQRLLTQAPGITLTFLPLGEDRFALLSKGELDFVVSPVMALPEGLCGISIGENEYVLAAGPHHPLAAQREGPVGNDEVLRHAFFDICFRTHPGEPVQSLREVAFPAWAGARIAIRTTAFLSGITSLGASSLLMVLPKRTAETLAAVGMIAVVATVEKSVVQHPQLIWHVRSNKDLELEWFRSVLLASALESA